MSKDTNEDEAEEEGEDQRALRSFGTRAQPTGDAQTIKRNAREYDGLALTGPSSKVPTMAQDAVSTHRRLGACITCPTYSFSLSSHSPASLDRRYSALSTERRPCVNVQSFTPGSPFNANAKAIPHCPHGPNVPKTRSMPSCRRRHHSITQCRPQFRSGPHNAPSMRRLRSILGTTSLSTLLAQYSHSLARFFTQKPWKRRKAHFTT